MENIDKILEKLNEATGETNMLATQFHLQFEAMAELQKDERENMRKHYENIIQKYTRIIFGLILTLVIFLGSVIGAVVYILSNYDLEFGTYQIADVGGDGTANIYDGIHYNDNSNAD